MIAGIISIFLTHHFYACGTSASLVLTGSQFRPVGRGGTQKVLDFYHFGEILDLFLGGNLLFCPLYIIYLLFMTCRINPLCWSMQINKDQISGIDPKYAASICIDLYWEEMIFIDQQWSAMIFIEPHWDQFLKSDFYWSALVGIGDRSIMSC